MLIIGGSQLLSTGPNIQHRGRFAQIWALGSLGLEARVPMVVSKRNKKLAYQKSKTMGLQYEIVQLVVKAGFGTSP